MGAWISLWLAAHSPLRNRIGGLVLIAPALNFFRPRFEQILRQLGSADRAALESGATIDMHDSSLNRTVQLRKAFAEATVPYEMDSSALAAVNIPVSILHGVMDDVVPYRGSLSIMEQLGSDQVEVSLVKGADHRFSDQSSLQLLQDKIDRMVEKVNVEKAS
jgi:alpha-beta hydrolase superfamily lysophospholipase